MNIPPVLNNLLIRLKLKEVDPLEVGINKGYAPYEELDGKRTTTLGMVFVVIMVIAGIWQGQVLLRSIQATIHPLENLSQCFSDAVSRSGLPIVVSNDYSYSTYGSRPQNYYDSYSYNNGNTPQCQYSSIETKHGFNSLYESLKPDLLVISNLDKEISDLQNQLWNEKNKKSTNQQDYNTSLYENMSGTGQPVYSSSTLSGSLVVTEDRITTLTNLSAQKTAERDSKVGAIKQKLVAASKTLEDVVGEYDNRIRFLELERFLTSFILLAPLAWFTMRRYFKAKNTRSEYSIIWAGAALIATLLFSQVMVVFVYRILPKRLIAELIDIFSALLHSFAFLVIILQWLGFILIPLFFGYLVYKIQKKFYNPLAVAMRAIKEGKCPKCSMKIKDAMVHCPMCSFDLRVVCPSCSSTSVCFAKFCEKCGKALPSTKDVEAK